MGAGVDRPPAECQLAELRTLRFLGASAGDDPSETGRAEQRKADESCAPPPHRIRARRTQRVDRGLFEVEGKILGRLVAAIRVLLETPADDPIHLHRYLRWQVGGLVVQDRSPRADRGRSLEGTVTGEHLVEDGAGAEDVGSMIGLAALHLLRGHVFDGAEDLACPDALLRRLR